MHFFFVMMKCKQTADEKKIVNTNHVIPLRSKTSHVTININGFLMLDSLKHGINDNESSGAAHSGTEKVNKQLIYVAKICKQKQTKIYENVNKPAMSDTWSSVWRIHGINSS